MTAMRLRVVLAILVLAAPLGTPAGEPAKKAAGEEFHARLKQIAAEYISYGRTDDEYHWAPWLCREPKPGKPRFSASKDEDTHGRKLYSLFVKIYSRSTLFDAHAVGQAIVKESWIPEEVTDGKKGKAIITRKGHHQDGFYPYATRDGKTYRASKKAALFIMFKVDPGTPGTDKGWVYGTVSPDGKQVTSAGCVQSCMKCHQTQEGRLFTFPEPSKK